MTTTDTRLAIDLSLVVAAKKPVAEDVVALYLTAPDGSDLPAWSPGAHVDLVLDDGVMRQYSLCGDIRDVAMWRIAVLREAVGEADRSTCTTHWPPVRRCRCAGRATASDWWRRIAISLSPAASGSRRSCR